MFVLINCFVFCDVKLITFLFIPFDRFKITDKLIPLVWYCRLHLIKPHLNETILTFFKSISVFWVFFLQCMYFYLKTRWHLKISFYLVMRSHCSVSDNPELHFCRFWFILRRCCGVLIGSCWWCHQTWLVG